ncbi:MAG TPA: globin domain-containing protein [Chitinophagaceae bacterium]|nr:globin domain-containing protein [Chitinophagaceae bacterium]
MNAQQVTLVQSSWEKVKPLGQAAGELFYSKLFQAAPGIRHMFQPDMGPQAGKLVHMLNFVVTSLHRLDTLQDDIRKLAVRHAGYAAEPAHYAVVGQCLIATLQEALDTEWNDELQQAWTVAYTILSQAMINAQQEVAERA